MKFVRIFQQFNGKMYSKYDNEFCLNFVIVTFSEKMAGALARVIRRTKTQLGTYLEVFKPNDIGQYILICDPKT